MSEPKAAFPTGAAMNRGMTLRDWYAGMAMQGLIAAPISKFNHTGSSGLTEDAFKFADAMIKEGKK